MIRTIRSKDHYHFETDWLSPNWHFSFDTYHDPKNMDFGPRRVFHDVTATMDCPLGNSGSFSPQA